MEETSAHARVSEGKTAWGMLGTAGVYQFTPGAASAQRRPGAFGAPMVTRTLDPGLTRRRVA